jgi:hypothetical protein
MGMARRRRPRKERVVQARRRVIREKVKRVSRGPSSWEAERWWCVGELGEKMSERVPVTRRAKVEVRAMMVTWVEGVPAGGLPGAGAEWVGIMVPSWAVLEKLIWWGRWGGSVR